jgi:trk system potassium uptake protein TrkH
MFLGGVNFSLMYLFIKGQFSKLLKNEEFLWYTVSIIGFSTIIMGSLLLSKPDMGLTTSLRYAVFNMSSIISSTGFSHVDYTQWSPFIWSIMLFCMLLGGCSGSTSGGIKIVRIVLLLKNTYHEFQRLIHPNAVIPVRFNGHVVNTQIINNVLAFIFMYVVVMGVSVVVFTSTGLGFDEAMGTTFAALTNVGLGVGEIGTGDYSTLSDVAKWYMSFLMLIGRLELFTVLIVLTPAFWRR